MLRELILLTFSWGLISALAINGQGARNNAPNGPYEVGFNYHNHKEMTRFLHDTAARYKNLTVLHSIGKSVEGRHLWVMVVSSSPRKHKLGKPNVKYVANIHGNEPVGRELMLHFIHLLVTSYGTDPMITSLLDNTRIHILPSMNPDGFEKSTEGDCRGVQGRRNARNFDLNRNFPDYFERNNQETQPEAEAVKKWISQHQFVLSASLHGGALVANYPYDNAPHSSKTRAYSSPPNLTPDNDVFQHLALTYSQNHGSMYKEVVCPNQRGFKQGITNGARWYALAGGMQDFNYVDNGCMEITLELGCCKYPPAKDLPHLWEENRDSLLKFLAEAHKGVHGLVYDENGNPIKGASMKIKSRNVSFSTTEYGEYWRILLPGVYKLEVHANGYHPREVEFRVVNQHPTELDVKLYATKTEDENKKQEGNYCYKIKGDGTVSLVSADPSASSTAQPKWNSDAFIYPCPSK